MQATESERKEANGEASSTGVAEAIREGLSQLGRTATGERSAYLRLDLDGTKMEDCSALAKFRHLQTVVVKNAGLERLDGLEQAAYLSTLDVSGNALVAVPGIDPPPRLLRWASFAGNRVEAVEDMSALRLVRHLDLSNNRLTTLEGLDCLPVLERLCVAGNQLHDCAGLAGVAASLRELDLSDNAIAAADPLSALSALTSLRLAGNELGSLAPLGALSALRSVDVSRNDLRQPEALVPLAGLRLLRDLAVAGNPLCQFEVVDRHVLHLLPQLVTLDGAEVAVKEKVHAANSRGADIPMLAAARARLIPQGELDDYGGTVAPICVTLEAATGEGTWADGVDAHAGACPAAVMAEGIDAVCTYLVEACETELDLLRAAYVWTLSVLQPPASGDMWVPGVPLLRPELAAAEAGLTDRTTGAWAERASALLASILVRFNLQAHVVHGFVKPLGSTPGTRLALPNHAWNAVHVDGRWRLLDVAWGAIPEARTAFFSPPEEFIYTHLPLMQRWQLLPRPVALETFWTMPQLTPSFFPLGLLIPEHVPTRSETGTSSLVLSVPADIILFPQLLEPPSLEEVTPHPAGTPGVPPGSFVFAEVAGASRRGEGLTDWEITVRLPEPSRDYCIRVVAARPGEEPVEVMMAGVASPGAGADMGRVLPNYHDQWLCSKCQLLSPRPHASLRRGDTVDFRLVVPGAQGGVAVGEPGGYLFELLERGPGDEYSGRVTVPAEADSLVVTTHSLDNPGVYMPLLKWHLGGGTFPTFKSRASSPVRPGFENLTSPAASPPGTARGHHK